VLTGIHYAEPTTIVRVGDARGLDAIVRAVVRQLDMPHEVWNADWTRFGKGAGHVRNRAMLDGARLLLAFYGPNGRSPGTANAMVSALMLGIPVWLHRQGQPLPAFTPITHRSQTT